MKGIKNQSYKFTIGYIHLYSNRTFQYSCNFFHGNHFTINFLKSLKINQYVVLLKIISIIAQTILILEIRRE